MILTFFSQQLFQLISESEACGLEKKKYLRKDKLRSVVLGGKAVLKFITLWPPRYPYFS